MESSVTREELLEAYLFLSGADPGPDIIEAIEALCLDPVTFLQTPFSEQSSRHLAFDGASPVLEPLNLLMLIYLFKLVFRWTIETGFELKVLIDTLKIKPDSAAAKDRKARIDLVLSIYSRLRKLRSGGSEDTLRSLLERFLAHESSKVKNQDTPSS